jgi:hypothetical protein
MQEGIGLHSGTFNSVSSSFKDFLNAKVCTKFGIQWEARNIDQT